MPARPLWCKTVATIRPRPPSLRRRLPAAWRAVVLGAVLHLAAGYASANGRTAVPFGESEHALVLSDHRIWDQPLTRYWTVRVPARPFEYRRAARTDPRFQQDYPYQAWGLVWERPREEKTRRVFAHYQQRDDEDLARRVAATLATIYWIAREYLGREPPGDARHPDDPHLHVWLTREGEAGAEEFRGHLYLYAVQQSRSPAEWIREIAHEYSHIILPRIGPYREPETWANGYLGERLLLKWLIDAGETATWGEPFSGPNYLANQVARPMARYLNDGPHSTALIQPDANGMERLIGFALTIEAAFGPPLLRSALARLDGAQKPSAFVQSVGAALTAGEPDLITVDARAFIPARSTAAVEEPDGSWRFERAAYWIYLPGGTWEISVDGSVPARMELVLGNSRLTLAKDQRSGAFRGRVEVGAWRRLELYGDPQQPLAFRRVRFRREPGGR